MTRAQWKEVYQVVTGDKDYNHAIWKKDRGYLMNLGVQVLWEHPEYITYMRKQMKNITATEINNKMAGIAMDSVKDFFAPDISPYANQNTYSFGNCIASTPVHDMFPEPAYYNQEGNNPMYGTKTVSIPQTAAYASSITIQAPEGESDAMKQRDYLLSELREMTQCEWRSTKFAEIRKLFNIDAPTAPKSSQEIIDAFAKSLITIDQAKVDAQTKFLAADEDTQEDMWKEGIRDRYYGITFTALPVADPKGYAAALDAWRKMAKLTERTIKIGSPADGLAAILAFEAWMPTQNAPTTTTVQ